MKKKNKIPLLLVGLTFFFLQGAASMKAKTNIDAIQKITKIILNENKTVTILSRYILPAGIEGRFSSDKVHTSTLDVVNISYHAQRNSTPYEDSDLGINFSPKGYIAPYLFLRKPVKTKAEETILELRMTVSAEFIEAYDIELGLAIPATIQPIPVITKVIPESQLDGVIPMLAPPCYEPRGTVKSQFLSAIDDFIHYIEYSHQTPIYRGEDEDFKYTFDAIRLYFGQKSISRKEIELQFSTDGTHIQETVIYTERYEEETKAEKRNRFFGWQLPSKTRFTSSISVNAQIDEEIKIPVKKSRNEVVKAYSSNHKDEGVWYALSDEVTGQDISKIKDEVLENTHVYIRYLLPPKTESQIRLCYEYVPSDEKTLVKKDYGLRFHTTLKPNIPSYPASNKPIRISVQGPENFHIEKTNYEQHRIESVDGEYTKRATFHLTSSSIKAPIDVWFAIDGIKNLKLFRWASFTISIVLSFLLLANVFFSWSPPSIDFVLPFSGVLWALFFLLIGFLGSNFLPNILFTGAWLPFLLGIILYVAYKWF